MLLDDAFEIGGGRPLIPNAFRINECDGPLRADTQAVGLGSEDAAFPVRKTQLLQPGLQEFPGFLLKRRIRALSAHAQKYVARVRAEMQEVNGIGQGVGHGFLD